MIGGGWPGPRGYRRRPVGRVGAAAAARTGKEVRAGLAGIMDIQIVVVTPVR